MKEEFRHFWEQDTLKDATRFLDDWCLRAKVSKLSVLQKIASSFQMHRTGLPNLPSLPDFERPLGRREQQDQTLQRQAYGYRDLEFFHLRIYSIHRAKHELVG